MNSRYIQPPVIEEQDPVPGYLETVVEPKLVKFILDSDAKVGQQYTIKLGEKGTHKGSLTRKDLERGYVQVLVALPTDTYIDFTPPVILISCAGSTEDAAIVIQDPTSLYSLGVDGVDVLTNVSITSIMDYITGLGLVVELDQACIPTTTQVTNLSETADFTISYIINNGDIASFTFADTPPYQHLVRTHEVLASYIVGDYNGTNLFASILDGTQSTSYFGIETDNLVNDGFVATVRGFSEAEGENFTKDPVTITFVPSENLPSGYVDGAEVLGLLGLTFHSCGKYHSPGF